MTAGKIAIILGLVVALVATVAIAREDKGVFDDLNGKVSFSLPAHLTDTEKALYMGANTDRDKDGISDQLDVLRGAIKAALNGASYDTSYQRIDYPGGDVPRKIGACTDVVIRACRNAGLDLQVALKKDIARRPKAYPHIDEPNPNIDHRRVRNLVVYMKRHMKTLKTDTTFPNGWLPGDIVLFDTLPKAGPDHIGIVSSTTNDDGLPLVINNWTYGSTTAEMDLLSWCPVTHHFRMSP